MKILLQDTATKRYLARGGTWSEQADAALVFADLAQARSCGTNYGLAGLRIIACMGGENGGASPKPPSGLSRRANPVGRLHLNKPDRGAMLGVMAKSSKMKSHKLNPNFGIAPELQQADMAMGTRERRTWGTKPEPAATSPGKLTEIAACIDVGLGNAVFIRGQGSGLSWSKGAPLQCKDASTWVWQARVAQDKLVFKLLLNDTVWSQGGDMVVEAGKRVEIVPHF